MILVTGAAGKSGQAVIAALAARGASVRALVHRPEQTDSIKSTGARQVVIGDMRQADTWERAMQGVKLIYFICPNVQPDELSIARLAIESAYNVGVERFVYHSVLHPQTKEMPHHWQKMRVEEQLLQSGLTYTILQPSAYMQNILAYWTQITEEGLYQIPYAAHAQISMVDLQDVAAAATEVLMASGHENAIYELAGPETLSQEEVVKVISLYLGRAVRIEVISLEDWEQQARQGHIQGYVLETLLSMFRYYDQYGLCGNSNVLSWLIGHPANSFADFVDRTVRHYCQDD